MKTKLISIIFIIIISISLNNCNAQKEAAQRRNLMLPKKDELPKNYKKYDLKETRKSYKVKKGKVKKTKKKIAKIEYYSNKIIISV